MEREKRPPDEAFRVTGCCPPLSCCPRLIRQHLNGWIRHLGQPPHISMRHGNVKVRLFPGVMDEHCTSEGQGKAGPDETQRRVIGGSPAVEAPLQATGSGLKERLVEAGWRRSTRLRRPHSMRPPFAWEQLSQPADFESSAQARQQVPFKAILSGAFAVPSVAAAPLDGHRSCRIESTALEQVLRPNVGSRWLVLVGQQP